ncbi:MAG: LysM peptidoglycan-binding domain-containing protein [Anaerolineales bacterium]
MRNIRTLKLSACALLAAFATVVCNTGYITPGSLAETEQAEQNLSASATVLNALLVPASTESGLPTQFASPTALASPSIEASPTPAESPTPAAPFVYTAQSGDSLAALAVRFGVAPEEIASPQDIPSGLIDAGQILTIPNIVGVTGPNDRLVPDSELVYSSSTIGFNTASYVGQMGGYLASYREYLPSDWHSGARVIDRVAYEQSVNPRLLLAVLQEQSKWVLGDPLPENNLDYPIGYLRPLDKGLYHQLSWAAKELTIGYYGWREGSLTELIFSDGRVLRLAPDLNAGTVAVQYLFSQLYEYETWLEMMDPNFGFAFTYGKGMFPDPWVRAAEVEPLFPPGLTQPAMRLPFRENQLWAYTSGPHGAWAREGAQAALDFAPGSSLPGCEPSEAWIAAVSSGLVVRSEKGVLVVDMDGDGYEQTGWVILYLHVTNKPHIRTGDWVDRGDFLGNPSCEGGESTATHLHIARKYNGEWISAGGPLPFVLSGWVAKSSGVPYQGTLERDGVVVTACTCSNVGTRIQLTAGDPY